MDLSFHVYFGEDIGPVFPLLGGGLEYFSIIPGRRGDDGAFTLEALFGVAYRF